MLLPAAFQDKDRPCALGARVERQVSPKADPIRDFERHSHDLPYVHEAKRVLRESWEANLAAKRSRTDIKADLDGLDGLLARIAILNARYEQMEEMRLWHDWAQRIDSTLEWPTIDAPAVTVGRPIYMYGTGD